MSEFDCMLTEDEINESMLIKYVNKHYKIYKVFLMNPNKPVNVKNPIKFEMFDNHQQIEVSSYAVFNILANIFSVKEAFVVKIVRMMAIDEFERIQKLQVSYHEGNCN